MNISDHFVFTGFVPHKDILKYYSVMDVLVYPRFANRVTETVTALKPLEAMALTAATKSYEDIQKIKAGVGKDQTRQFTALLSACNDFIDQNGESFGDVCTWDDSRCLAIDSLSGVNAIIMAQTIGYKPSAHMGEWGVAMNMQLHFLLKLTSDVQCFFALLAHVDKELSELTGLSSVTTKAIGRKNAPEILKLFSEVVYAKREGKQYLWSTEEFNTDTKQRGLPLSGKIEPDFAQIVNLHTERKKRLDNPVAAKLRA